MLKSLFGAACALILAASAPLALAADFGTAAEARAMLDKAAAAVKADKAGALSQFAKGEGGFKDRDLYPFCGGPDGNFPDNKIDKEDRTFKFNQMVFVGAGFYFPTKPTISE